MNQQASNLESFDDLPSFKVEDMQSSTSEVKTNDSGELDTFDDMTPKVIEAKQGNDQRAEKSKDPKDSKDSNVELLDDQTDEGKKEEGKEEIKKDDEKKELEAKEEVKEESKPEVKEDYKPTGKVIKGKDGDHEIAISNNTVLPVKVDGKVQEVPVQELINNYSGKQAVEKRFQEVDQEKKTLNYEKQVFQEREAQVKNIVNQVFEKLTKSEDPNDALLYLVDTVGGNPVQYMKKVFEANLEQFEKFLDMDEVERRLFWTEKEKEYLEKKDKSYVEKQTQEVETKKFYDKLTNLRETYKVSEQQYVEGYKELVSLGYDKAEVTPEAVVEYVSLKPHLDLADDMLSPYSDFIDDAKVEELAIDFAKGMRSGEYQAETIKQLLEKEFGSSSVVKDLNVKEPTKEITKNQVQTTSSNGLESFDDFDY